MFSKLWGTTATFAADWSITKPSFLGGSKTVSAPPMGRTVDRTLSKRSGTWKPSKALTETRLFTWKTNQFAKTDISKTHLVDSDMQSGLQHSLHVRSVTFDTSMLSEIREHAMVSHQPIENGFLRNLRETHQEPTPQTFSAIRGFRMAFNSREVKYWPYRGDLLQFQKQNHNKQRIHLGFVISAWSCSIRSRLRWAKLTRNSTNPDARVAFFFCVFFFVKKIRQRWNEGASPHTN